MKSAMKKQAELVVPTVAEIQKVIEKDPSGLAVVLQAILARTARADAGIGMLLGRAVTPSVDAFDASIEKVRQVSRSVDADRDVGDPAEPVAKKQNIVVHLQGKFEIGDEVYACYYDFKDKESALVQDGVVTGRTKETYVVDVLEPDDRISTMKIHREDVFVRTLAGKRAALNHLTNLFAENDAKEREKALTRARLTMALLDNPDVSAESLKAFGGRACAVMASILGLNMFADLAGVKGNARFELLAKAARKYQAKPKSSKKRDAAQRLILDEAKREREVREEEEKTREAVRNAPVPPGRMVYGDVLPGQVQAGSVEKVMTGHIVRLKHGDAAVRRIADNDRVQLQYMASGDQVLVRGERLVRVGEKNRVPLWAVRGSSTHREFLASGKPATPPPPKKGTCKVCGRVDVTLREDGRLALHDNKRGVACNLNLATGTPANDQAVLPESQGAQPGESATEENAPQKGPTTEEVEAVNVAREASGLDRVQPKVGQLVRMNGKLWKFERIGDVNATVTREGKEMVIPVTFKHVKGNVFEVGT
jgi:hypothetical protein